jgi:hypothetical protein
MTRHVMDAARLLLVMATIVYQGVDETVSEEIDDEKLNYRENHWQIHHGDDEYTYIPENASIR